MDGDQIRFFGSDLCEGEGTYTWSIDGGVLIFTPEGDDPCGESQRGPDRSDYQPVP